MVDFAGVVRFANPEASFLFGVTGEETLRGLDFGYPISEGNKEIDLYERAREMPSAPRCG